jgi:protein disulfide-isomerase A6
MPSPRREELDERGLARRGELLLEVVRGAVVCRAAATPVCETFGVRGYPTIKNFTPPAAAAEDYKGGRSLADLKKFAKNELGPGCSVDSIENCTPEQKTELEKYTAMSEEERATKLEKAKEELKTAEDAHNELLKQLQSTYKDSQDKLEKLKEDTAPVIKMLKAATSTKKAGGKDEV